MPLTMITHGNISRLLLFLSGLLEGRFNRIYEFRQLCACSQSEAIWIEQICEACRLTRLGNETTDILLDDGIRLAQLFKAGSIAEAFRLVLELHITARRPVWAFRMPMGREEVYAVVTDDVYYCLSEAGLTGSPQSPEIVAWWDRVSAIFRSAKDAAMLRVGREGERLTMCLERVRTGRQAKWVSFESNFAGYDILSTESVDNCSPRLIEVKASRSCVSEACFYVSRNEWETALTAKGRYFFYLWDLSQKPRLAVLSCETVGGHIASNNGLGEWESVRVPFAAFATDFVESPI